MPNNGKIVCQSCRVFLLLCLFLLFSGCSGKSELQGLPSAEEISQYERLYEQKLEEAAKYFGGASEEQDSIGHSLKVNQKRILGGEPFETNLFFYPQDGEERFYCVELSFRTADREKAEALIQTLYDLSVEAYGEPDTYVGLLDRIKTCYIEKTRRSDGAQEVWNVGEKSEYLLTVSTPESEGTASSIILLYRWKRAR